MDDDARTTLRVTGVRALADPFVRIEASADAGAGPVLPGAPDEACVLHVPLQDGSVDEEGRWYTIRRVSPDGLRVTVDIVAHAGGVGAGWARRARVGDEIGLSRVASWYRLPAGARWQVLVGDAAVVPAIARIVEESPPDLRTEVVLELPEGSGPPPLPDGTTARVVAGGDDGTGLEQIARGLELPDGPGLVFVAGEAAATRAARRHLRHERGLAAKDYKVVGYWRRDADHVRARYRERPEAYAEAWARAEAAGGGDEERVLDVYERALGDAGLL